MGEKTEKAIKAKTSNISSAANPAVSSTTSTRSKSSILKSSFAPSHFQLSLFASVIQGLDSQHLRIHDTTTSRLRCEHAIASKATITCLDWGYFGKDLQDKLHREQNKKRKRSGQINGDISVGTSRNIALGFGTSDSEIHIFSPLEAKVVSVLRDGHTHGIRDFKFADHGLLGNAWSIGGDGKLLHWDVNGGHLLRSIILPLGLATTICPITKTVICASHTAYILDPESSSPPITFNASTNSVHAIIPKATKSSKSSPFATAADADHCINIFDGVSPTQIGSLLTENDVLSMDFYTRSDRLNQPEKAYNLSTRLQRPQEAISVVNKDGALEIFPEPFDFSTSTSKSGSDSLKARMKQRTRKAAAQVRITRPDERSTVVPLINASFQGSQIALAWTEGAVNLCFDTIPWRDEESGDLLVKEITKFVKSKSNAGVSAVAMNGVKDMGKSHVDESKTVIANGDVEEDVPMHDGPREVIDISSGEEESELEEDSEPEAKEAGQEKPVSRLMDVEESADPDVAMEDAEDQHESSHDKQEAQDAEEPSFGDLIGANAPEAIDVQASFADPNAQSLVPTGESGLQQLPSGMSLGTVLTQSLRTNDRNLLETCFHVKDLQTIRATIERLDSSFASTLLQRLAERLHSRPGRAGSLMVWIQWTLVAHGGYLAGQPEVMRKLASLHRVVKDRANSLQSLLCLKGKLDMLEAQMNLRKSMQARPREADEDDEEGVVYVEGQESDSEEGQEDEDAEEEEEEAPPSSHPKRAFQTADPPAVKADGADINPSTETPQINGIANSEDEDEDTDSDGGIFDAEAAETDQDSGDDLSSSADEVDHDSVDTESSDADPSPPPKRPSKMARPNGTAL